MPTPEFVYQDLLPGERARLHGEVAAALAAHPGWAGGTAATVAAELAALEAAMADPDQMDQLDSIIERFGEVQGRFEALGGYALEGRAREVSEYRQRRAREKASAAAGAPQMARATAGST